MKKGRIIIFLFLLISASFLLFACGGGKDNESIEAESKEEEAVAQEENSEDLEIAGDEDLDIYDQKKIAEFVMGGYLNNSFSLKEFMDEFQFYYFDINEDSLDEAFIIPRNNDENILGIMLESNEYKIIFNEAPYKYSNEMEYEAGFLKTTNKTGTVGETSTTISLWKWNGKELKNVLRDLPYEYFSGKLSSTGNEIEGKGIVEGSFKNFEYSYLENEKMLFKKLYKWNDSEFKYDIEDIEVEEADASANTGDNIVLRASEIKLGDEINGLKVTEIQVESDYMVLSFSGEISINGSLVYDDYYQGFFVMEKDGSSIGISVEFPNGQTFNLPASVYIMNTEKLEEYENIDLNKLLDGEGSMVLGDFTVRDYSCMAYYESEFGVTGNLVSASNITTIY